jgi:hypothetical protein
VVAFLEVGFTEEDEGIDADLGGTLRELEIFDGFIEIAVFIDEFTEFVAVAELVGVTLDEIFGLFEAEGALFNAEFFE